MFENLARPLVLASGSKARQELMEATGLSFEIAPADIDERAVEDRFLAQNQPCDPSDIAQCLATHKAQAVSKEKPDQYVIGGDQILTIGTQRLNKVAHIDDVKAQLMRLRGKTHQLHSALAIVKNGTLIWSYHDTAHLTMRAFSETFLNHYLTMCGDDIVQSVGCYQLESYGIQLFENIKGDYFTILGFPMLALLEGLRQEKIIET